MANSISIKLDKNWKILINDLKPKSFMRIMKSHLKKATTRNAIIVRREIRQNIRKGVPPTNAPLTATIKGGTKPIVGTPGADLFNSVTYDVKSWDLAFAGILRTNKEYNIGRTIHYGKTIKVTKKMRHMFHVLWLTSIGSFLVSNLEGRAKEIWESSKKKKFYPLKETTKAIVIPKRPFVRYALQEPKLRMIVEKNWLTGIGNGFKQISDKGKK